MTWDNGRPEPNSDLKAMKTHLSSIWAHTSVKSGNRRSVAASGAIFSSYVISWIGGDERFSQLKGMDWFSSKYFECTDSGVVPESGEESKKIGPVQA